MNRQPHAVLDLASRQPKARKIELLLELESRPGPLRLLEVGTGSGGISHYFGSHPSGRFDVDSVDVHDNRKVSNGYRFTRVDDTTLPFPDECFDVVISNHVIEHVGDFPAQLHHLSEMKRVLSHGGVGYLAVPNRWMLVEPHYRLAFLSWWPKSWRSTWLRLWRKGDHYDCTPLQLHELDRMLQAAGLTHRHLEVEALHTTAALEGGHSISARIACRMPDRIIAALRPFIPTLICSFEQMRP